MANQNILRADKPPAHLSREAKRIWRQINSTWDMANAPDALLILRTGMEAFDRLQQARTVLDAEGCTIETQTAAGDKKIIWYEGGHVNVPPATIQTIVQWLVDNTPAVEQEQ